MKPFRREEALAAPLMRANIDTDQIIRMQRLIEFPRGELGPYCLEALRFDAQGEERTDFAPNTPRYRGAGILVAAENFGCGSSREHAVWALIDWGVRAVIAPSVDVRAVDPSAVFDVRPGDRTGAVGGGWIGGQARRGHVRRVR